MFGAAHLLDAREHVGEGGCLECLAGDEVDHHTRRRVAQVDPIACSPATGVVIHAGVVDEPVVADAADHHVSARPIPRLVIADATVDDIGPCSPPSTDRRPARRTNDRFHLGHSLRRVPARRIDNRYRPDH